MSYKHIKQFKKSLIKNDIYIVDVPHNIFDENLLA